MLDFQMIGELTGFIAGPWIMMMVALAIVIRMAGRACRASSRR